MFPTIWRHLSRHNIFFKHDFHDFSSFWILTSPKKYWGYKSCKKILLYMLHIWEKSKKKSAKIAEPAKWRHLWRHRRTLLYIKFISLLFLNRFGPFLYQNDGLYEYFAEKCCDVTDDVISCVLLFLKGGNNSKKKYKFKQIVQIRVFDESSWFQMEMKANDWFFFRKVFVSIFGGQWRHQMTSSICYIINDERTPPYTPRHLCLCLSF